MYFILGLAMCFIALWDYNYLPRTASRLVKRPGDKTGFSLIVLAVRNMTLMTLFAFFLWPVVVLFELSGNRKK
jgi:hypothetical protein